MKRDPFAGLGDLWLRREAARLVIAAQSGSIAMLQSKLRIGFGRARGLMVDLEEQGIVGPFSSSTTPREVLVTRDAMDAAVEAAFPMPGGLQ